MVRKKSSNINIPLDLTLEILKKLPAKSLARFHCVSKQWTSIIREFIVIDSIVTRSLTQPPRDPHFIIRQKSISRHSSFSLLSLSYAYPRKITKEEHIYHKEIFGKDISSRIQYVRGLVGFLCSSKDQFTIFNPTTRQSVSLPKEVSTTSALSNCVYLFELPDNVTFLSGDSTLINHQGKLAWIGRNKIIRNDVDMWVLENAEKQEWVKHTFSAMLQGITSCMRFAGVTHPRGEIILVQDAFVRCESIVYYYDPYLNTSKRIDIKIEPT